MDDLPLWMLLHFVAAAAGTWWARRYALGRQLLDQPGERRSHAVPTPRGGGVAIVLVVLGGLAWVSASTDTGWVFTTCLAAGLLLVAGIGWLDDHRPLPSWPRLLVHLLAAGLLAWAVHVQQGGVLLPSAVFALTVVLVNAWNFMDGINGLAASQALIVAVGLAAVLAGTDGGMLAAGLAAAVAGFLPFNFPKARIFLGDVGSGSLGFLLAGLIAAALPVVGQSRSPWLLLPLVAFLVDTGFTLVMRMLRGERWWAAHVQHTYQKWAARQDSHVRVTLAYAGFTMMSVALMLVGIAAPGAAVGMLAVLQVAMAVYFWARLRRDVVMGKDTSR